MDFNSFPYIAPKLFPDYEPFSYNKNTDKYSMLNSNGNYTPYYNAPTQSQNAPTQSQNAPTPSSNSQSQNINADLLLQIDDLKNEIQYIKNRRHKKYFGDKNIFEEMTDEQFIIFIAFVGILIYIYVLQTKLSTQNKFLETIILKNYQK